MKLDIHRIIKSFNAGGSFSYHSETFMCCNSTLENRSVDRKHHVHSRTCRRGIIIDYYIIGSISEFEQYSNSQMPSLASIMF